MDQIRFSRFLFNRLSQLGIDIQSVIKQAKLNPKQFEQERMLVTTAQWFGIWQALDLLSDDPALGLKISTNAFNDLLEPLAIVSLSSRTFHEALQRMARYKRLFCAEEMQLISQGSNWVIEAVWVEAKIKPPKYLIDSMFASFLELGRQGIGRVYYPELVRFRRKQHHRLLYEAFFRCPVEFETEADQIIFSDEVFVQPLRSHNPEMLSLLEPALDAALHENQTRAWTSLVQRHLRNRLAGQALTMADVAHELNISTRTLQRRLADEGTKFQGILEQVRHQLAQHYLSLSQLDINEIAHLLGYEEASSFHRAFQHWEGTSPGQWRTSQAL